MAETAIPFLCIVARGATIFLCIPHRGSCLVDHCLHTVTQSLAFLLFRIYMHPPLVDDRRDGWVDSPNFRGTGDIIWSCFAAVFVCTWTVLHLNPPSAKERENPVQRYLRKAKWMTLAVLVPEVVTASAFAQRVAARNSVRLMREDGHKWSFTQAYFLNMGGVWLEPRESAAFPINAEQLRYLINHKVIDRETLEDFEITEEDIWDRSKADKFAKLFACLQIFWLALQCIARRVQNLSITPLEIATLGFSVPSLATFALWYNKPVDIDVPTKIRIKLSTQELLEQHTEKSYKWRDTPLDFICKVNSPSVTSELVLKSKTWPGRSRFIGPANRIRNDVFALKYTILDQVVVASVWVAYGGTHFAAWDFEFPTRIEMLWWRYCCITMSASMGAFWILSNRKFFLLIPILMPWYKNKERFRKIAYEQKSVSGTQIASEILTTFAYLVARLSLIALAFSSLRSMPDDTFKTINWIAFLPHLN